MEIKHNKEQKDELLPSAHNHANPLLGAGASSSDDSFVWESLSNEKVLIGLSGGINSMAVLCQLVESGVKPKELHLFYCHFEEHSPDTFKFVRAGIDFARKHFDNVKVKITRNSVLRYFEKSNMIPHPMKSPCSFWLKIEPIARYSFENGIKIDLVGYVKKELKRRSEKQQKTMQKDLFSLEKHYPIGEYDDEWCFDIVKRLIGWYPAIYDILYTYADYENGYCSLREVGSRVFKHNNCLPCKSGNIRDLENVKRYFYSLFQNAIGLSRRIEAYWGRSFDDFYSKFGRELGQESTCESCAW